MPSALGCWLPSSATLRYFSLPSGHDTPNHCIRDRTLIDPLLLPVMAFLEQQILYEPCLVLSGQF